jgi:hypothetical protein
MFMTQIVEVIVTDTLQSVYGPYGHRGFHIKKHKGFSCSTKYSEICICALFASPVKTL